MTSILCGTDFSEPASGAARVAAGIAARLKSPLHFVHVRDADRGQTEAVAGGAPAPGARLSDEAKRLREEFGIEVESSVEPGVADEALPSLASRVDASLVVVGSLGARTQHRWLLGSVAERVAQVSPVPVLVVRDGARLEAWTRGEHTLRVLAGVEITPVAHTALRWALDLGAIGPTRVSIARIAWPVVEHERLGVPPPMPLDRLKPELERALLDELRGWVGIEPLPEGATWIVRAGWGRADVHLSQLAEESDADLLVVGTNRRALLPRFWQGSVSRGVLHAAPMSVACVPARPAGAP